VRLDEASERTLLETIEEWLGDVATHRLPGGIFELRNLLLDERAAPEHDSSV
jgi:hypothetical protein